MGKETFKFWLIYNTIIFAVYFLISSVLFLYTGSTTWTLSYQTVPVWVLTILLSFIITYMIRKHLGFGIFVVTIMVLASLLIHFIHQINSMEDLNTGYLNYFLKF